jgi:hypothetical protein
LQDLEVQDALAIESPNIKPQSWPPSSRNSARWVGRGSCVKPYKDLATFMVRFSCSPAKPYFLEGAKDFKPQPTLCKGHNVSGQRFPIILEGGFTVAHPQPPRAGSRWMGWWGSWQWTLHRGDSRTLKHRRPSPPPGRAWPLPLPSCAATPVPQRVRSRSRTRRRGSTDARWRRTPLRLGVPSRRGSA